MTMYRKVVGEAWSAAFGSQLFYDAVIAKHSLVAPLNLVVLARVQLFVRTVIKSPDYVLQLLSAGYGRLDTQSCLRAVEEDVGFLANLSRSNASDLAALPRECNEGSAIYLKSLQAWARASR